MPIATKAKKVTKKGKPAAEKFLKLKLIARKPQPVQVAEPEEEEESLDSSEEPIHFSSTEDELDENLEELLGDVGTDEEEKDDDVDMQEQPQEEDEDSKTL